ncbi:MAG: bifunctional DNA primase/polymerase, partial [Dehalococcoidia bacterium]|nr:bifunctional DNA primase/polymerase [Dehalococcoidia bacterium]
MGNDVTQNARWMAPYGCLDAALHYLNKGYSVIATEPQGKRPLGPWTTFQKRLPTKAEVRAMWQKQPDANVAIVTGAISGIFALDTDGAAADNQIHKLGGIPTTPTSRTAKGRHYIFQHPGFHVSNRVHLYEGVDIRGDGGYIVVPPSIHPTGIQYTWDISLEDATPAKPPSWLLETLSYHEEPQPATDSKPPDWVMQALQGVAEGERDDTCHRLACHYLAKGICPEEVALLLLRWNERNHPPMGKLKGDLSPEEFVKQKIESARSFLEESSYAVELQQKLKSIASLNLASERELKLKELSTEMDIPIKALRKDLATVSASTKYTVGEAPEESFTHEELMKGR